MTHYEVLGVSAAATTAQVRAAFRRLVREHHPDTSPAGSVETLAAINEAWRVLGDPRSRRDYDRSLLPPQPSVSGHPGGRETLGTQRPGMTVPPPIPAKVPWRFLAGMAAVGIALVMLGVFTYKPSKPGPPDNVLEKGSCVVIQDNGDAVEVNCDDSHDGVVDSVIGSDEQCPPPLEPHRDRLGLGVACISFDI
jgi:hypothetical protein